MKITVPGFPETIDIAKSQARRLATVLSGRCVVTHGQALEIVAGLHGERTWGAMIARFSETSTRQGSYDLGLPPIQTSEQTPARTMDGWRTHELRRLADVLRTSSRRSASDRDRVLARIVGDGCVAVSQLDELLDTVSSELGDFCFALTGDRVVELFGIETQSFLSRPGEGDVRTTGARCIALAGAASLLAILEDLGFETRPEILVDVVNRTAAGRRCSPATRSIVSGTSRSGRKVVAGVSSPKGICRRGSDPTPSSLPRPAADAPSMRPAMEMS